ncbi:CLUMA_CG002162, isoform A [Clunio marinus]|uniref:CLUMA_CG002162, isoform A n=1 Tax=Clunio marinus TaxID=568069 RepID=A0A1J1HQ97_9DIPT|nr:CLUMA_CG002162, isoform A [Clunio marinus]
MFKCPEEWKMHEIIDTVGLDWSSGCDYTTDQTDRRGTTSLVDLRLIKVKSSCQLSNVIKLSVKVVIKQDDVTK